MEKKGSGSVRKSAMETSSDARMMNEIRKRLGDWDGCAHEESESFEHEPTNAPADSCPSSQLDLETRYELLAELEKTEDEIVFLRQMLDKREKRLHCVKRKLGITAWDDFRKGVEQGIVEVGQLEPVRQVRSKLELWNKTICESPAFERTSQTLRVAGERTGHYMGTIATQVKKGFQDAKSSSAFKTIEESVGSVYQNAKGKLESFKPAGNASAVPNDS